VKKLSEGRKRPKKMDTKKFGGQRGKTEEHRTSDKTYFPLERLTRYGPVIAPLGISLVWKGRPSGANRGEAKARNCLGTQNAHLSALAGKKPYRGWNQKGVSGEGVPRNRNQARKKGR